MISPSPSDYSILLGVSAINPLVAFYNVYGRKREVLFFYFVPDTTRDTVQTFMCINMSVCFGSGYFYKQRVWLLVTWVGTGLIKYLPNNLCNMSVFHHHHHQLRLMWKAPAAGTLLVMSPLLGLPHELHIKSQLSADW
jgi:hypothetical protein